MDDLERKTGLNSCCTEGDEQLGRNDKFVEIVLCQIMTFYLN